VRRRRSVIKQHPKDPMSSPNPVAPHSPEATTDESFLAQVDREFTQLGCLGHGGFGSVFLAKKRSGRQVALKCINFDPEDDGIYDAFVRELDAVVTLNSCDGKSVLSIVFFEDWIIGPSCAFIVMNYVDGGTVSDEIVNKTEPYTERRIAWYALQLSEALAFAHERGVAHHDVKSANVLIDQSRGGKLLLADFGSAVAPGQESILFTEIYASPELLTARERDDFSGIRADKVDSFGLGCIIFELLCCKKLVELTSEQTLAEHIRQLGADVTLNLPCVQFPWLPAGARYSNETIGYSDALKGLARAILNPNPEQRWTLSQLLEPLRNDPNSPLIADCVAASKTPISGSPVTVDNVQLGMFVQRGQDWNSQDGDADGGLGSIGAVISLDPDAGYTEVAWPYQDATGKPSIEPMCHRIGESRKYELQVGPVQLPDFYSGSDQQRFTGLVDIVNEDDASKYPLGHKINSNCMVVGTRPHTKQLIVVPVEKIKITTQPVPPESSVVSFVGPRKAEEIPETWDLNAHDVLVEVTDVDEKQNVMERFFSTDGGMDLQYYEIASLKRVQSQESWKEFSRTKASIASEYWGVVNEQRLFLGTEDTSPQMLVQFPGHYFQVNSEGGARILANKIAFHKKASNVRNSAYRDPSTNVFQVILARVVLGRVKYRDAGTTDSLDLFTYHSETFGIRRWGQETFGIRRWSQAFPEYLISFKQRPLPGRRILSARRPDRFSQGRNNNLGQRQRPASMRPPVATPVATPAAASAHNRSTLTQQATPPNTKMCVVCWERPVSFILIPCGHPCLCEVCSTEQGLKKLKKKCPECREKIAQATRFYGRIAED
jgi:serine/threonine protein kinase